MPTPSALAVAKPRKTKKSNSSTSRPKLSWRKRDDQDSRLYNLKLDINDVKMEIARLHQLRTLLEGRTLNQFTDRDGTCWKAVVEYFRVFAKGFLDSPHDAVSYIHHAMAADIHVNNFSGREVVLEQWKTYSAVFPKIDFRFINAVVTHLSDSTAMVRARARYHTYITRQTLGIMFPHIVNREDIVRKLLGKPITDIGKYDFIIDAKTFEILRCDVVLDFFSCFAKLLPNARDLAVLFNQALLRDEFYIGDVEEDTRRTKSSVEESTAEASASVPPPSKMRLGHILIEEDAAEEADTD